MKTLDDLIEETEPKQPTVRETRRGMTPVIILSVALGILLSVIAVGAYVHYQTSRALESQLLVVESELKSKSLALDEMETQIRMLSKHIQILKEYAIARSGRADDNAVKASDARRDASAPVAAKDKAEPVARTKKAGATAPDCEMAGKSPAQQAAALQRCVGAADAAGEKPAR